MDVLLLYKKIKKFPKYVNYKYTKGRAEITLNNYRMRTVTSQRGTETRQRFSRPFLLVFSTDDGLRETQCPELENHDCENNQLPADLELVWDLLFQLYPCKSIGPDRIH